MALTCPTCGFENPAGMRFCGNCGSALAATPAGAEERKLVTILFADVVASTQLTGAVDPERLRAQMGRFFAIAREEVERYGGTVEKFIGDAVMAAFGLPTVHEDDAERGARAAAAIRERVRPLAAAGELPQIRVGLSTGEVVADPRAVEKGEFLVTGETVNLAARLQQNAAPGQILIGQRTALALGDVASTRALPPLAVKGRADPLPVWELTEIGSPRERALRPTPFVGRLEELDLLRGHVRRMVREGRGHVVTILGAAGVGKTRLVLEFRERTAEVHILRGRAIPYGSGVPFWSLGQAIREECGILFGDPLDAARQKLEETAAALEVSAVIPALLSVLGLGGERRDLTREELFAGMRAFFQTVARRAPLLLALEDFHSAEDVTLDFVELAADWSRDVPLLLLVLARPELLERRPAWMGGKRSATTLFLEPLAGEESLALAHGILEGKAAPQPLLDLVLARAGGNPLFMEEMLRVLIEGQTLRRDNGQWALTVALREVAIPDTVQAVIGARVDALPPAEKQTLQGAAVQGKDFWLGPLRLSADAGEVEDAVGALVEKELLIQKPRSTLIGEEEYTFRHILIRDVAYAMIPKARRLPQHQQLAEWTTQMAADRPAEWADYVAHHWLQVLALGLELGLPPDPHARSQAIANLLVGGERAAAVYANATALDHYSRALDLDPERPIRLRALLGRGEVWMFLGQYEQARDDFETIRRLAVSDDETGEGTRWEALALDRIGHSYRMQDQIPRALEHFEAALAVSRSVEDHSLTGRILTHIGFAHLSDGRLAASIAAHQQAQSLLGGGADPAGYAASLHGVGDNLVFLGRFPEAVAHLAEAAAAAEAIGNRSLAAENTYMMGAVHIRQGAYPAAQAETERAVAILTEIGDVWNLAAAHFVAAERCVATGELGKALEHAARGVTLAEQVGAERLKVYNLHALGMVHRELEDYNGAWPFDRESVEIARRIGGAWPPAVLSALALDAAALARPDEAGALLAEARGAMAEQETRFDFAQKIAHAASRIHLLAGAPAAALSEARELQRLAEEFETEHFRSPALALEGDALLAQGDPTGALRRYQDAVREAERLNRLPILWRALAGVAESQRALGGSADAAAASARARELVERLAASMPDERLRAVFLQSGMVQRLVTLSGS